MTPETHVLPSRDGRCSEQRERLGRSDVRTQRGHWLSCRTRETASFRTFWTRRAGAVRQVRLGGTEV